VVFGMGGGDGICVLTLVGRPCMACYAGALGPGGLGDGGAASALHPAPARLALGALAANEALRVLLSPPAHGRLTRLSFKDGVGTARDLATAGCSYCNSPP